VGVEPCGRVEVAEAGMELVRACTLDVGSQHSDQTMDMGGCYAYTYL